MAFACGMGNIVLEGQSFSGTLAESLVTDTSIGAVAVWNKADPSVMRDLRLAPDAVSKLYRGELDFGTSQALHFGGALCLLRNGDRILFIDLHTGSGELHKPERIPFLASSQPYYLAEAKFSFPLHKGPFRSVPAYVALPKDTSGFPTKPNQAVLIVGSAPYVTGRVRLPKRQILVRYAFDLDTDTIDLGRANEWFDLNADGKFDSTPGSAEQGTPSSGTPIFDLGRFSLKTETLNLATHNVILKVVPVDQQRIQLVVGGHIPDFTFKDFSGESRELFQVKGKYILLDFWATWCAPCVADLPYKKAAYDRFHAKGFEIFGMNGDAKVEKPKELLHKLNISWPEAKPDTDLLEKRFHITTWPTVVLIDSAGTIISTSQADHLPLSGQELQTSLSQLLQ